MHEAAASCKDISRTPVKNWKSHGVTLARYCSPWVTACQWLVMLRCYVTSCQFSSQQRNVTHYCYGMMFCYGVLLQVWTGLNSGRCLNDIQRPFLPSHKKGYMVFPSKIQQHLTWHMKVSKLCDGVSMGAQLTAVCDPHVPPDLRPHDFYFEVYKTNRLTLKRKTKKKNNRSEVSKTFRRRTSVSKQKCISPWYGVHPVRTATFSASAVAVASFYYTF